MKRVKTALTLLLSLFCIYLLARFCHVQTAGFKLTKIENNFLPLDSAKEQPLTEELLPLLNQTFFYLGRGLQSFSFVSEDGAVVLKLFNNSYQRRIFWLSPLFSVKTSYYRQKLSRIAESYALAAGPLKEKTAVLYAHLTPSQALLPTVTLIDKLHIAHRLNLNFYAFALQRKGELAYSHITSLMQSGKEEEAKSAVCSVVEHIQERCRLGIADSDPLVRTNLGFLEGRPFYIDLGPFSIKERAPTEEEIRHEVFLITRSFHNWLELHHPSLTPSLNAP